MKTSINGIEINYEVHGEDGAPWIVWLAGRGSDYVTGMTIIALQPRRRAASATPCA